MRFPKTLRSVLHPLATACLAFLVPLCCSALECTEELVVGGEENYEDYGCAIDVTPDGRAWVVWTGWDPAGDDEEVYYSISEVEGWSHRLRVHPDNTRDDRFPDISIGNDGVPWVVYNTTNPDGYKIRVTHWDGADWSAPQILRSDAHRWDVYDLLAVDSDDIWFATDAHVEGSGYRDILVYHMDGTGWNGPWQLGLDEATDRQPDLALHPDGHPWVVWNRTYPDTNTSQIICSAWADTGWTTPSVVDDDPCDIGMPQIAFDGVNPLVVWVGNGCTGTQTDIEYRTKRNGLWSTAALVNLPDGDDDYDAAPKCETGYGGSVWVTWLAGYSPEYYSPDVVVSRWSGLGWSAEEVVSAPGLEKRDLYPALAPSLDAGVWVSWECYDHVLLPRDEDIKAVFCDEATPVDFAGLRATAMPDDDAIAVSWYAGGDAAAGPFHVWRAESNDGTPASSPPDEAELLTHDAIQGPPYLWVDTSAGSGVTYAYWVTWERGNASRYIGPAYARLPRHDAAVPASILSVLPNPSRRGVCVTFEQSEEGVAALELYDVTGRRVGKVIGEPREPGRYTASSDALCWSAQGDAARVASGVYLARLLFNGKPIPGQTERLTVVR